MQELSYVYQCPPTTFKMLCQTGYNYIHTIVFGNKWECRHKQTAQYAKNAIVTEMKIFKLHYNSNTYSAVGKSYSSIGPNYKPNSLFELFLKDITFILNDLVC